MECQFPFITLIDADAARRHRLENLMIPLGVRGTSLADMPTKAESGCQIVVLVGDYGARVIAAASTAFPAARVVVCGISHDQSAAITAFRGGADDFVWLGAGDAELAGVLTRHLGGCSSPDPGSDAGLIGVGIAMKKLRAVIAKLAPTSATVLITGETGTGKDVAALAIHRLSKRAGKPLVALNCAAIPDALIEGELFGYERGAFSGAHAAYPGKIKLADGGTLLLDEIGELSLAGQAKLLRAIECREVWRLGARTPTRFDVRIIAVTNRDLAADVRAGRFREDLFYRFAVSQLRLPPLRERLEDVEPLARHLLAALSIETGTRVAHLSNAALERLASHRWPGNVRELRNALEIALINGDGEIIRHGDLPSHVDRHVPNALGSDERSRLIAALGSSNGNKSLAAQSLNCSRMTLYRRMQRYGLAEDAEPLAVA